MIAPIRPDANVEIENWALIAIEPKVPLRTATSNNAAPATRTEAKPPKPLNNATSCGISVILILTAKTAPIPPPTTIPARIIP